MTVREAICFCVAIISLAAGGAHNVLCNPAPTLSGAVMGGVTFVCVLCAHFSVSGGRFRLPLRTMCAGMFAGICVFTGFFILGL